MRSAVLFLLAAIAVGTVAGRCRYNRPSRAESSECNAETGLRTLTLSLKEGQDASCQPTKTITRRCTVANADDEDDDDEHEVEAVAEPEVAATNERRGKKRSRCRYEAPSLDGAECDPETNTMTLERRLAVGQPESCDATKTISRPCIQSEDPSPTRKPGRKGRRNRPNGNDVDEDDDEEGRRGRGGRKRKNKIIEDENGCKYRKPKGMRKSPCRDGEVTKEVTLELVEGEESTCPDQMPINITCKRRRPRQSEFSCDYRRSEESVECDATTRQQTIILVLSSGDAENCAATRNVTRPCRNSGRENRGCDYVKGNWTECEPGMRVTTRTDTLVEESEGSECDATRLVRRRCNRRPRQGRRNRNRNDANQGRNAQRQAARQERRTAKAERKAARQNERNNQTKEERKAARKAERRAERQRERQQQDGPRDVEPVDLPLSTTATEITIPTIRPEARQRRVNRKCRYEPAEWSVCTRGVRTRERTLTEDSPSTCNPVLRRTAPCHTARGKEKCFFGSWGSFGKCQNGVQTKLRPVIGGEDIDMCKRKAVQTKPCCVGSDCESPSAK